MVPKPTISWISSTTHNTCTLPTRGSFINSRIAESAETQCIIINCKGKTPAWPRNRNKKDNPTTDRRNTPNKLLNEFLNKPLILRVDHHTTQPTSCSTSVCGRHPPNHPLRKIKRQQNCFILNSSSWS